MVLALAPLERIDAALSALAPRAARAAVTDPAAVMPGAALFPIEAAAVARAVPGRRAEFRAGRAAVRQAMAALGHAPAAVPMGRDRAPVWPAGLTGSISHCTGACVALVARRADLRALAVDIEPDTALPGELLGEICGAAERAWLEQQPPDRRLRLARLIFSAKECVYKLVHPICGKMIDFSDVEIEVDVEKRRFAARLSPRAARDFGAPLPAGRFDAAGGFLICVMFVPQ